MKKIYLLLSIVCSLIACDQTTQLKEGDFKNQLLPQPKTVEINEQLLALSEKSELYSNDASIAPLVELCAEELQKLTSIDISITKRKTSKADILFILDQTLDIDEYQINIDQLVTLKGGSYQALAMAKTTLLQLAQVVDDQLTFPLVNISDRPDAKYRGLMIDLARQWHEVSTIKQLIDLAAFYKMNYLHLHFTDYQSYTLPSKHFPKLATAGKQYTLEELEDLEKYSQQRGVTIIPEIDVPGHSSPFVQKYPEIFAIQDTVSNPWIINMGKEEVYEALDKIIGETCQIFKSSPYFHIGGDEAYFYKSDEDEDVQAFMKKHELGEDIHELYRYFIVRLNDIVKKHQKQMCVWEGFRKEGNIQIPRDIIVFEFETNRYLPNLLVEDGYTVVNTSWKPLYVVNQKKWEPKTIYNWNIMRWENWFAKAPSFDPIQVETSPLVIGAQMCAWEQSALVEIPSLRKRLPAMAERIWNTEQVIDYEEFFNRLNNIDNKLSIIIEDTRQDSLLVNHNFEKLDQ